MCVSSGSKMAPMCLASRRSRLSLLFAAVLFFCFCCRDVSALLVYDRQALLNIRAFGETLLLSKH